MNGVNCQWMDVKVKVEIFRAIYFQYESILQYVLIRCFKINILPSIAVFIYSLHLMKKNIFSCINSTNERINYNVFGSLFCSPDQLACKVLPMRPEI